MKRREFILALGGTAASSAFGLRAARAQQGERMRRIGVVVVPNEDQLGAGRDYRAAFYTRLAEFGWIEGLP